MSEPGKIIATIRLVKFEHSVFALPFAITAAFLAKSGVPDLVPLLLIVVACVFARTAAMSFNRFADARIDAENPRTADREIPKGIISRRFALLLALGSALAFSAACALINMTVLALSPVAIAILFTYSYAKRATIFTHLILGISLGLAPLGTWIALREDITAVPVILAAAVALWTAGFDIIYSLSDVEFDRARGLYSLPAKIGIPAALLVSRFLHVLMVVCLGALPYFTGNDLGWVYMVGVGAVVMLLAYEHSLVKPTDLSKVNVAFFTMNGFVSILFMAAALTDILIRGEA